MDMLRNVALGRRKEIEAKHTGALEMDLELAWVNQGDLWLYLPKIWAEMGLLH